MKRVNKNIVFAIIMFGIGCNSSTSNNSGTNTSKKLENVIIGTWLLDEGCEYTTSYIKITIEKNGNSSYSITHYYQQDRNSNSPVKKFEAIAMIENGQLLITSGDQSRCDIDQIFLDIKKIKSHGCLYSKE